MSLIDQHMDPTVVYSIDGIENDYVQNNLNMFHVLWLLNDYFTVIKFPSRRLLLRLLIVNALFHIEKFYPTPKKCAITYNLL